MNDESFCSTPLQYYRFRMTFSRNHCNFPSSGVLVPTSSRQNFTKTLHNEETTKPSIIPVISRVVARKCPHATVRSAACRTPRRCGVPRVVVRPCRVWSARNGLALLLHSIETVQCSIPIFS